jgi:hypothetical protein
MNERCALVLSPSSEGWFLPALLTQAGWSCEVVSLSSLYALSAHVRRLHHVEQVERLADQALDVLQAGLDAAWVIVASDELLADLRQRALLDRRYLALLPLVGPGGLAHLFSKLQLSRILDRSGLSTPAWRVATSPDEALQAAEELGYPCFLKRDACNGGRGVARCLSSDQLSQHALRWGAEPLLVQQELNGPLWGVEALFWRGQLQAYAASESLEEMHAFGPSLRRRYGGLIQECVALEQLLQQLGKALLAHGWANISLIQTTDCQWHCFEVDLRPTVWLALDQALGGDFADVIESLPYQLQPTPRLCYRGELRELEHPQRLLQMGVITERLDQSWMMMPDESTAYLAGLREQRFAVQLKVRRID